MKKKYIKPEIETVSVEAAPIMQAATSCNGIPTKATASMCMTPMTALAMMTE